MNVDLVIRHFGNRSVAKLAKQGVAVLSLEQTQGGPMYRVQQPDGREVVISFNDVADLLGW